MTRACAITLSTALVISLETTLETVKSAVHGALRYLFFSIGMKMSASVVKEREREEKSVDSRTIGHWRFISFSRPGVGDFESRNENSIVAIHYISQAIFARLPFSRVSTYVPAVQHG